jgi:hypothetical protein
VKRERAETKRDVQRLPEPLVRLVRRHGSRASLPWDSRPA